MLVAQACPFNPSTAFCWLWIADMRRVVGQNTNPLSMLTDSRLPVYPVSWLFRMGLFFCLQICSEPCLRPKQAPDSTGGRFFFSQAVSAERRHTYTHL